MNQSKPLKLLGLIAGVVLLNIIVLSPGLVGLELSPDNPLEAAIALTLLIVSLIILLYGSYTLLLKPPAAPPVKAIQTHEDYIEALAYYRNVKPLKKDIEHADDQLDRLEKKKGALLNVLGQRFDPAELSYKKFISVIHEVEKLFYLNIRGLLNKLSVFDASDFAKLSGRQKSSTYTSRLLQQKTELYNEYYAYVERYLGANEEILHKLDKLLLEISLLGSISYEDVEEMPCMKEIDALINQTKYYKP